MPNNVRPSQGLSLHLNVPCARFCRFYRLVYQARMKQWSQAIQADLRKTYGPYGTASGEPAMGYRSFKQKQQPAVKTHPPFRNPHETQLCPCDNHARPLKT